MAARIAAAGFELVGFDAAGTEERLPAGRRPPLDVGDVAARPTRSCSACPTGRRRCAIVDAIVAAPSRRVTTRGRPLDGRTAGRRRGRGTLLAPLGVTYVDGPVSGGVAGAKPGTRLAHVRGATPWCSTTIARSSRRSPATCSTSGDRRPGAGDEAAEQLPVGDRAGRDVRGVRVRRGPRSRPGRDGRRGQRLDRAQLGDVDKFPNRVLTGTYDAGFHTALMAKDLRLYVEIVRAVGNADDVGSIVSDVWQRADAALPGSDFTEIWRFVSRPGSGRELRCAHDVPRAARPGAGRRTRSRSRDRPRSKHPKAAHAHRAVRSAVARRPPAHP